MNPMVPLDLGDFFSYKRYGHLIGYLTPIDLGHDILDLGYDILNKNKKVCGKRSRQIPRQNIEVELQIFGLTFTIKITKVVKEGFGLASNYKKASLFFLYHLHYYSRKIPI